MRRFFQPSGVVAALAVCILSGLSASSARAAAIPYTSVVSFANAPLSSPSTPVLLSFYFPGYLIDVESITISGTFGTGVGAWNYYEQFAFSAGSNGPTGSSYYQYSNSNSGILSFTLSLFPAPNGTQSSPNRYIVTKYPSGDPAAFKDYLLTQLASTGGVDFYFQPQPQNIYTSSQSQFQLLSATLTVVGVDPPRTVTPIPSSLLLFVSGLGVLFFPKGDIRRKLCSAGLWRRRRRQDSMRAVVT